MRYLLTLIILFGFAAVAGAAGEAVTYQVDGKPFQGYWTSPGPSAPLVLLVHDWDGLTDYEIQRADMLAGMGYAVFAVDLFGAGIRPQKVEDKRQHTGELYRDRARMRALMQAGLAEAKARGGNVANAVAVGYCFGGAAVLEYARSGADLKGFVTFHGGLETPEDQDYAQARGTFLIFHGSADTAITLDDFAALARQLEEQGLAHEMITYGGAPHAFTVFDTPAYRETADRKSWRRFGEWLKETL
jgi:dienelactone hydrolase